MIRVLSRLGLHYDTVEDEKAFANSFLRGTVRESQAFLILSAGLIYVFAVWDRIIDPVHWQTTHLLRGLVISPGLVLAALALSTAFAQRRFEWLIVGAMLFVEVGLAIVYAVLDRGYEYAALGFALTLCGTTAMFPVRSRYLFFASLLTIVIVVVGQLWADNARPGWLFVNLVAVLCAIGLGTLSAYIRERNARAAFLTQKELDTSRQQVDDLLHSMLPREIVARIQAGETVIADVHGQVTVIFADIMEFAALARKMSAAQLVKTLNELFSMFDLEAERCGVQRIKTMGDAYMAVSGLGRSAGGPDHAESAAELALAMQRAAQTFVGASGHAVRLRVGLHVGSVVAGVIGVRRPAFDCWGDTVNLARRLESHAEPGTILVSESAAAPAPAQVRI
jgi:class 3 adenylate cyclase